MRDFFSSRCSWSIPSRVWASCGLVTLGLIAGVSLLFGFLAGPLMAGKLTIGFQPLVSIAYIAAGAGWILFPIWCWRLAVHLK